MQQIFACLKVTIKESICLGTTLPAFVSPNVLNYLVENFDIASIGDPKTDLAKILA